MSLFYVDGSPLGREFVEKGVVKVVGMGWSFLSVKGQMSQIYQNFLIKKFSLFFTGFSERRKFELIEFIFRVRVVVPAPFCILFV